MVKSLSTLTTLALGRRLFCVSSGFKATSQGFRTEEDFELTAHTMILSPEKLLGETTTAGRCLD